MQWDRSNTIGVAKNSCSYCSGEGTRVVRYGKVVPCNCVFRAIFRACYNRFRFCVAKGTHTSTVSLEMCHGRDGRRTYSRKREEFIADFSLVSKRALDEADYQLFRFHFLLGADWKLCCRRLNLDRGNFFHAIYRIEQILGRAFAEVEPYPLFPLDEYFASSIPHVAPPPPKGSRYPRNRPVLPPFRLPLSA